MAVKQRKTKESNLNSTKQRAGSRPRRSGTKTQAETSFALMPLSGAYGRTKLYNLDLGARVEATTMVEMIEGEPVDSPATRYSFPCGIEITISG